MLIKFDVTQEDIDKAGHYLDNRNCLGCTVFKRILKVEGIHFGGGAFGIYGIVSGVKLGHRFMDCLFESLEGNTKPETHSIDIPDSTLEQIGYFDQKGSTTPEDYINERGNVSQETGHQGNKMVEEESY